MQEKMCKGNSAVGACTNMAKRSKATVLAIGTANPYNVHYQSDYPEWYFRVTNPGNEALSEEMEGLKSKFKRICERSDIRKRYMVVDEHVLESSPNMCKFGEDGLPSLKGRLEIARRELPKLAKEACHRAINEWGRSVKEITHLVFNCTMGGSMPGADYALIKMLGLNKNVKRSMFYLQGCYAGGTVLRHAKDIAESNRGSRVLAVCSEINALMFRGPHADHIDNLVGQCLFGDGASALIVGCDVFNGAERGLFELYHCSQTLIMDDHVDDDGPIEGVLSESGLSLRLDKDLPKVICSNLGKIVKDTLKECGVSAGNDELFWVAHPGGRGILDAIEKEMGLGKKCLEMSRHVLREYGNMSSACALFVLDETRKRSSFLFDASNTGLGHQRGLLLGFGPGVTIEAIVLRSLPLSLTS